MTQMLDLSALAALKNKLHAGKLLMQVSWQQPLSQRKTRSYNSF